MFERFTYEARRVVVVAQEEARLLNHNYIGTEHLLLGLLQGPDTVPVKALANLGLVLVDAREAVEASMGRGTSAELPGHLPFTPRAKKVLELSLREALQLGHNYIGAEHILLGMIREGEGEGAKAIIGADINLASVRQQVIQVLSGYQPPETSDHPAGSRMAADRTEEVRKELRAGRQFIEAAKQASVEVTFELSRVEDTFVVKRVTSEIVAAFVDADDAATVMDALLRREERP